MTPPRALDLNRISATTASMFDLLSDGNWHEGKDLQWAGALALITDDWDTAYDRGFVLRAKSVAAGRVIEDYQFALSGGNDRARNNLDIACRSNRIVRQGSQYRMHDETRQVWKAEQQKRANERTISTAGHDPMKIRTFNGINEHDAFHMVPVATRDRVMFKTNHPIPQATFQATNTLSWSFSRDDSSGLYRIDGPAYHGRIIEAQIKTFCEDSGIISSDLRIISNVKNRDLNDLDPGFLNELVAFYQPFLAKRLRKSGTSLQMHIPDYEDQYQQIGEWLVSCVREYDESKGVPFGAFLVTRASHRVHDLQRNRLGRTTADNQNQAQKASSQFTHQYGRNPNRFEMAHLMGKTQEEWDAIATGLDLANKVLDPMSIQSMHDDNQEIPVTCGTHSDASLMEADEAATFSAALIGACVNPDGSPDLVAFGHWYYKFYAGFTKSEAAKTMGVSSQAVALAAERSQTTIATAMQAVRAG